MRLKIFTERGKDLGNVQIPYFGASNIYDIAGRTIHPDGSIVELKKDSIFDKVIEKRGFKTKVITFALPDIQPGSIIEYKYVKTEGDDRHYFSTHELEVQSAFPVDEVRFYIKPLPSNIYPTMRFLPFGCRPEHVDANRDGFDLITVKDVPAFHEEPYSPPELSAKQWILIFYEDNGKVGKDKYWTALGKDEYKEYGEGIKVNGELKQLAAQLTAGATTVASMTCLSIDLPPTSSICLGRPIRVDAPAARRIKAHSGDSGMDGGLAVAQPCGASTRHDALDLGENGKRYRLGGCRPDVEPSWTTEVGERVGAKWGTLFPKLFQYPFGSLP